jgi:acetolactate synthase-1/2/3 large subunit
VPLALKAITDVAGNRKSAIDKDWAEGLRAKHRDRIASAKARKGVTTGDDGKIHPQAIFDNLADLADPDYIGIADGGDLLSFARTGLQARTYMDAGAFGCLGVGVPFAIAASLAMPDRQVISVNGDGAFGINGMEIDTAVRHGAKCVFIISNNAAWNIERLD